MNTKHVAQKQEESSPLATDLESIIERARAGTSTAIGELHALYGDAIQRYCAARLGDTELAQDCAQDVFVRVWRSLPTFEYRGDASFTAWMYTIASRVVISQARKHTARPQVSLTMDLPAGHGQQADTARLICDRLALHDALRQLTLEQQQVVTLKFFLGFSNQETGAMIGRTEGAVKAMQHRAINRLQRLLSYEPTTLVSNANHNLAMA